jgi:hypothetical protein
MASAIIARVQAASPRPPAPPVRQARVCMASVLPVELVEVSLAAAGRAAIATLLASLIMVAAWFSASWWRRYKLRSARPALVQAIFCADGHNLDEVLPRYYRAAPVIDGLFELGNLHVLGPSLTEGTVAFSRDRDEPWQYNEPQTYPASLFEKCPPLIGQARVWYLHDGERWWVKDGRGCQDSWKARRTPWREL